MPALVVSMSPEILGLMPSVARNWMPARFVVAAVLSPQPPCQRGRPSQSPHRVRCSSTINQNTSR